MNDTEIISSIEEYYKKNKIRYEQPKSDEAMTEIYSCYVIHPEDAPEHFEIPIQNVIQVFDGFMLVSTVYDPTLQTVIKKSSHKPELIKFMNFLNSNIYLPLPYNPRFTMHMEAGSQMAVETMVPQKLFEISSDEFMDATANKIPQLMVDLVPAVMTLAEGETKFDQAVTYVENAIMGRHHECDCGCEHDNHEHSHDCGCGHDHHEHDHSHDCGCGHHHMS